MTTSISSDPELFFLTLVACDSVRCVCVCVCVFVCVCVCVC